MLRWLAIHTRKLIKMNVVTDVKFQLFGAEIFIFVSASQNVEIQ